MIHSEEAVALWSRRLEPLFPPPARPLQGSMELRVGEGLVFPSAQEALDREVRRAAIARERAQSAAWLRRVIAPERLDPDAHEDLLGLRAALLGLDALFGAAGATPEGQLLQVAVTQERIHVRTRLPAGALRATPAERAASAIAFAKQLFQTDAEWDHGPWNTRELLGLGFANREVPFARTWPESGILLTDGAAVLYTFVKLHDREGPPAGGSAVRNVTPWFPPPADGARS